MEDCFCEGEAAVKKRGTQYSCELLHAGKRSGKKHGMIDLKQFELLHWHGLFCIGLARHDMAVHKMLEELGLDDDCVRNSPAMLTALFHAIFLLSRTPAEGYLREGWYL